MARIRNPAAYQAAIQRRQMEEMMQQQQQQQQMAMQQAQPAGQPQEPVQEDDNPLGAFQTVWGNRQPSREGSALTPSMKKERFISAFEDVFGGR